MAEPWHTLKRVLTDALERVRRAGDQDELPPFAPRYDRVFESLTREQLYGDSTSLLEDDLVAGLFGREQRNDHFLNFYSYEGAKLAFERYGFFALLRDKGFEPLLRVDVSNPDEHRLRIYDRLAEPGQLLIELAIGFRDVELPDGVACRTLFINWLLMQNPRDRFSSGRPPLPDQEHPGLGLFPHFGYLIRLMALRLGCDGLLNHPAHFHNAVLYGRFFHFVDPVVEGRFRALERDLEGLALTAATEAIAAGRVAEADGTTVQWKPAAQVAPITNHARAWFASDRYTTTVERVRQSHRFSVATAVDL